MSIASVCRTLPTPADPSSGIFVMRRLAALAAHVDLQILQPIPYFPIIRPLPAWVRSGHHNVSGQDITHSPMFYVPKFFKSLDSRWLRRSVQGQLATLKKAAQLDLIDAHFAYPDGAGCLDVARELDVPFVVTIRGVEEDYMQLPYMAKQIRETLQQADACICVSHSLGKLTIEAGANPDNVHVIHNAINRELYAPGDKARARTALGLDEKSPLVVSVGNLLSVKRHDVLISAFAQLSNKSVHLAIVGGAMHEPDYPRELDALCRKLGVADRVRFVGRIDENEVAIWLKAADMFALASRREGCCNAILEALATGVPVVATAVGDNPSFIKDGQNGYLVPVGDSEAMARAIDMGLTAKDWDAHRISSDLQVGDWNAIARETKKIFERCIMQRSNSSQ